MDGLPRFCRTGITEFNERSIINFPVQGTGADILRLACVWATRHGLELCGPVHDAIVIEAPEERIEADLRLAAIRSWPAKLGDNRRQ